MRRNRNTKSRRNRNKAKVGNFLNLSPPLLNYNKFQDKGNWNPLTTKKYQVSVDHPQPMAADEEDNEDSGDDLDQGIVKGYI